MSNRARAGDAAGPSAEGPARVLVVDDEPNITDLVSTALRYEGFEVEAAATTAARRSPPSRRSART